MTKIVKWMCSVTMGVILLYYSIFKTSEFLSMWYEIKETLWDKRKEES